MIIVMIIFSLLYIILLTLILIAYYRDVSDIEKRMLYLEKMINDLRKENNIQRGCDCEMPCGRKKGRGGRRK